MCPAPGISEGSVPPPPSDDEEQEQEQDCTPLLSGVRADVASWVLQRCGVTLSGIKVIVECPELQEEAVSRRGRGWWWRRRRSGPQRRDGCAAMEVFVSSFEASSRPLDAGQEGLKLVVRVDQVGACSLFFVRKRLERGRLYIACMLLEGGGEGEVGFAAATRITAAGVIGSTAVTVRTKSGAKKRKTHICVAVFVALLH